MKIKLSDHFTYGKLLRFTLPSIVMMICTSIYSVVDGLFVSNLVGENALSAVNIMFPPAMIVGAVGFMLGAGGSAIVARTMGEGKQELANQYFTMIILCVLGAGVALSALALLFVEPIARLAGASDLLMDDCIAYGRILLGGSAVFMLQVAFQVFFVTAELPKTGLFFSLAAGATNIMMDYLLIGPLNMGIAGAAWLGSAAVLAVVMAVSRRIHDIMVILILGIMFGSGIGAVVEIMQYLSNEAALKSFVVWTMGSLGDVTGPQLALLAPVVCVGLGLAVLVIKPLDLLLLGENYARTMGLHIPRARALIFLSTILLAGTVTAFCGPVGFVGLAVPHIARMLFRRADHRTLMPASMLAGASLLLGCDLLAKTLALPINSITALMGIPVVILVVVRNRSFFG